MTKAAPIPQRRQNGRRAGSEACPPAPRDWVELLDRLRACRVGRSAGVAKVAAYALDKPLEIAFGTTTKIAEICCVSPPAVVLLAQRVGFAGFIEMRDFFRLPLRPLSARVDGSVSA